MDLTNELVEHPVFGTGKVISQDDRRITIQFSEETGEKRFIYPDAFEKYLKMCNPAAAQKVLEDLRAKTERIQEQQRKEEEAAQKAMEKLALAAQKREQQRKEEEVARKAIKDLAPVAQKRKSSPKIKQPKSKQKMI
ncbi:MAG: hypothetical protein PHU69_13005 [Fermentimonas sp.]|jgi:hypothetical protein|nr:hypothetical protein [Fermentimonas sp.]